MIKTDYRGSIIEFDESTEEWVIFWEEDYDTRKEFKRDSSLKKAQELVDRFYKRTFRPIPILIFDCNDELRNADIISFTNNTGECWIKYWDNRREKINTSPKTKGYKKIYACENIHNESRVLRIFELDQEIKEVSKTLQQKQRERIHLKDQMEPFDINGYVLGS